MSYSHTTRAQFKTQLAERLGDTGKVFWIDDELTAITEEVLRTFGLLTGFNRVTTTPFNTSAGVAIYDLNTNIPGSKLTHTLTDQSLVGEIQYHLLEPKSVAVWTGTDMFTMDDLTRTLQRRLNRFLVESRCYLKRVTQLFDPPPPIGKITLDDDVMDIVRLQWYDVDDKYYPVWRGRESRTQLFDPSWTSATGIPTEYAVVSSPPLVLQLMPIPADKGSTDMIRVESAATLDPTVGVVLGIPDDLAHIIKWGAIEDLLRKDGVSLDEKRADYCKERWDLGLQLASLWTPVVNVYVNGVQVQVSSVYERDRFKPGWQGLRRGAPSRAMLLGNLLFLDPVPNDVYSINFDLIEKTPMPANDAAFLQVGREHLSSLLDLGEHIARFKCGGSTFAASMPLLESFVQMTAQYSKRTATAKLAMDNLKRTVSLTE